MPLLRYFTFVGGLLVAVLFAANWIWPADPKAPPQAASAESPVEQTIRIQSAQRWPDKIVFDTNQPTIVPPPPPPGASAPPPPPVMAANSPLDARAELKPAAQPAPPPKRQARARHRNSRPDPYNSRPDAWHDNWRHPNTFAFAGPTAPSWPFGRW